MKEYKIVQINHAEKVASDGVTVYELEENMHWRKAQESILNLFAKQGWRLVQVVPMRFGGDIPRFHDQYCFYMERDI